MFALLAATLAAPGCNPFRREKPVVRLYDGQWDSIHINNAIAKFIIEKGYGYRVETVAETSYVMQMSMQKGTIDANLEARQQNWGNWYKEQIRTGNILSVGVLFEGGSQFFVIPKWVAEKYDIETIFDMREHWQLFKDPEDPSKGIFYNGIIGWGCHEINAVKLEAYGLTKYYNIVSPGSAEALEAVLARAQMNHQPVFGYCWAPNALMGAYEWHILREPIYTDESWEKILAAAEDESLRPVDQACAYEIIPMEKIIHRGMLKKAPEVVEMMKKMAVGLKPLNRILAWTRQNNIQDWRLPAIYFLREYEDVWETWVTPQACKNIKDALRVAPGGSGNT